LEETARVIDFGTDNALLNCDQIMRSFNVVNGETLGYTGFKFGYPLESMDIESRLQVNVDGVIYLQQCIRHSKVSLE
jgi:hypothetical protein